jgi:hypothetical protein
MIGVNEKLIRRAIEQGKISKGVDYTGKKPKIIVSIAKQECIDNSIGMLRKTINVDTATDEIIPGSGESESHSKRSRQKRNSDDPRLIDYQIQEKRLKNEALEIDLKVKTGRFVDKNIIDKELADKGLMIRDNFMALPDRETDNLLAMSSDRDAFYQHFQKIIRDMLTKLSSEILKDEPITIQ